MSSQDNFCINIVESSYPHTDESIAATILNLIWVVGILGNLVNLVVFRHKNMAHPINSIFWWLSISDLFELTTLKLLTIRFASYKGYCELCSLIDPNDWYGENIYDSVLILISMYLFYVAHTITICLNAGLLLYQYKAVAYPLMNQKDSRNNRSIKLAVIYWIYILNFVLWLPHFYIYEILPPEEASNSISWRIVVRSKNAENIPTDPLVDIIILFTAVILRAGLLIILITLCILFLFAMRKTYRDRQSLGVEAHQLSNTQREVNRLNVTIVVIIIMFLITEVPLVISASSMVLEYSAPCFTVLDNLVIFPCTLFNCCYNIFCYLIRSRHYRETIKLLLSKSNWVRSRSSRVTSTSRRTQYDSTVVTTVNSCT